MDFITVRHYLNSAEASFAASHLQAAGLMVFLRDESALIGLGAIGAGGGIRLQVPTAQGPDAELLLKSYEDTAAADSAPTMPGTAGLTE